MSVTCHSVCPQYDVTYSAPGFLCVKGASETSCMHKIANMSNPWKMFHSTLMTFHAMVLWETTESLLSKPSQNCSNVSTHLLSPNILQQETCPLNSCVYFILIQYPLRRVNAPEAGPLPHPYDFTWPDILSPLSSPLCVSETPPDNVFNTHDCVTFIHSNNNKKNSYSPGHTILFLVSCLTPRLPTYSIW